MHTINLSIFLVYSVVCLQNCSKLINEEDLLHVTCPVAAGLMHTKGTWSCHSASHRLAMEKWYLCTILLSPKMSPIFRDRLGVSSQPSSSPEAPGTGGSVPAAANPTLHTVLGDKVNKQEPGCAAHETDLVQSVRSSKPGVCCELAWFLHVHVWMNVHLGGGECFSCYSYGTISFGYFLDINTIIAPWMCWSSL